MLENEMQEIIAKQREFYQTGQTRNISFRLEALRQLKSAILANEQPILNALKQDLHKPLMESYTSEIGMVIGEINSALTHLKKWTKPVRVPSTFIVSPAKSYILSEPFGVALIISPWNYPIQLSLVPLVGAIAAGNCCILKPSEFSVATSGIIKKLIQDSFDSHYITVIEGDVETSRFLLEQHFDKIFFTGSPRVGKIVMEKAARYLTSVTLELGGKSPCIVDKDIDVEVAVKRILWGKFINAGQTCVAPDYLLVHRQIKDEFYYSSRKWLRAFFSENPEDSPDYCRIISREHFNRLKNYLRQGKVILGGNVNEEGRYMEPTLLEIEDLNQPVMQEEIFGPILPVIEYATPEDVERIISLNPDPLAFYVFSRDKAITQRFIHQIPFGGGCINDTINHITNQNLPFGGRGNSGIGNYHDIYNFQAFSHQKAILEKGFAFDMPMKYPPYMNGHTFIRKFVLK
jgi:aldehyde dehydrogenase (NAD+)